MAPTRRQVLGGLALAGLAAACGADLPGTARRDDAAARLAARPGTGGPSPGGVPTGPGTHALGLEPERDTLLHVPPVPRGPLAVTLHGAGGDAGGGLTPLLGLADERGALLLAPASRGPTWDAVGGRYGPDVEVVDRALAAVLAAFAVDPARVAVSGFSDGASYALGLGLANGDLFGRVAAFSPGFVPGAATVGRPAVFVSHGTGDDVLPIDRTSREIVPRLEDDGYDVTYREFDGPHVVPAEVARAAADWLGWT
ncbi:alpha/beta hydrolase [Blastococcus sp. SYSU D00813]